MAVTSWTEWWFIQLAGQTLICLAVGCLAAARMKRSAARAHTALFLAMLAAAAAPLSSRMVKELNGGSFPGMAQPTQYALATERISDSATETALVWDNLLIASAGLVSTGLLLGIAVSYSRGRRLVAHSTLMTDGRLLEALAAARLKVGLRTQVRLLSHPGISSPMVWAWSRLPAALVPDEATLPRDGLDWESIFIHELAHLRRCDHVTGLIADVVGAVLFWNPAIWACRRLLAKQSEFACDAQVARAGKSAVEFAGTLLALRREALIPSIPGPSLAGGRAWLKVRVHRLLACTDGPNAESSVSWTCAAVFVAALLVIALALAQQRDGVRPEESFAPPIIVSPAET